MNSDFENLVDKSLEMLMEGLSLVPCFSKDKCPKYPWKLYQKKPIGDEKLYNLIAQYQYDAVAIICGEVSGGFECIDFDQKGKAFYDWMESIEKINPELQSKLVVEQTQGKGFHVSYRCKKIEGNKKLASDENGVLIETRGEGGLVLVAPSKGYELRKGDYSRLSEITEEDREFLFSEAIKLNKVPEVIKEKTPPVKAEAVSNTNVDRSGEPDYEYNEHSNFYEFIQSHGWKAVEELSNGTVRYSRPGGTEGKVSADFNGVHFHVFSSNAEPFQEGRSYNKFQCFTLLNCGGDIDVAKAELVGQGFGEDPRDYFDPSGILQNQAGIFDLTGSEKREEKKKKDNKKFDGKKIPKHLLEVGGLIGMIKDYNISASPQPNEVLAFMGGMSMMSFICGKLVKTEGDVRPNINMICLANSGTGKEFPRKTNKKIAEHMGRSANMMDEIASGQGLEDTMLKMGKLFAQVDEVDELLANIADPRNQVAKGIESRILKLYSSADSILVGRAIAGKDPKTVKEPHFSFFGTCTPQGFDDSITEKMLKNGLFSRTMFVESYKKGARNEDTFYELPDDLLEACDMWNRFKPPATGNLGAASGAYTVPTDLDAKALGTEFGNFCDARSEAALEKGDLVSQALLNRGYLNMMKYALNRACSDYMLDGNTELVIRKSHIKWSIELTTFLIDSMIHRASKIDGGTNCPVAESCKKLISYINSIDDNFCSLRELYDKGVFKTKFVKDQVIATLEDSETITTKMVSVDGKRKKTLMVVLS